MNKRLYFVDNLRSLLVLLLIFYHLAMAYNCWGEPNYIHLGATSGISDVITIISPWYMPLLFLLAGISASFSLKKRGYKGFILERFLRLGIPFIFGVLLFCPLLSYIADVTHNGYTGNYFEHYAIFFTRFTDLSGYDGGFTIGHLWFLLVLLVISLVVLPFIKLASLIPEDKKKVCLIIFSIIAAVTAIATLYVRPFNRPLITFIAVYLLGYYLFSKEGFIDFITKGILPPLVATLFIFASAGIIVTNNVEEDVHIWLIVFCYMSFTFGVLAIFAYGKILLGSLVDNTTKVIAKISNIIYIIHLPIVVFSQYLLNLTGINNIFNFVILLVVLYPLIIAISYGISKIPFVNFLFGYKKTKLTKA